MTDRVDELVAASQPRAVLELVPADWETCARFVGTLHRHHAPPAGWKWGHAVEADGVLVGVAMVGRPVARAFDDGRTVECNRTCTDGHPNVNSMLYGAVARAAFAKGYRRVITYTQEGESGASLKAAGWRIVAERPARTNTGWATRPGRSEGDGIARTLWEAS